MSARRTLALAAAAALAAAPAPAQDIEALAEITGQTLPPEYYARVRQNPDFFETRNEWRARAAAAAVTPGAPPSQAAIPLRGELRMVVMMGLYADSPEPSVSASSIQERLFGEHAHSLTAYYREISAGAVTLRGTVLPWVRSGRTRAEAAGRSYGLGVDADMPGYLRDVVARVDPATHFGQYDNDGPDGVPNSGDDDGIVDLAVFQFDGPAASCGVESAIWPHRAMLSAMLGGPFATDDLRPNGLPVLVSDYHIQSAVNCDGTPQSIGVIAHETGHAFGLPDFYDARGGLLPAQRRWVLGCFTLMAGGSWGCGDGASFGKETLPAHMGPLEKLMLGWIGVQEAAPGWRRTYLLDPVQTSGRVLRVQLIGGYEYLLLEYRPNTGFDQALPAGGVLVYHVENSRPLAMSCRTCPRIYHSMLVEADGDSALLRSAEEGGNRGVAGDVFTTRRVIDDRTHPHIRLNSGLPSHVALEIEVLGPQARVIVSTLPFVAGESLLAPLLGTRWAPPDATEAAALDYFGNRDGRYELGDLRAYMMARPGVVQRQP